MLPLHPWPCLPPHRPRTSHKRASPANPPILCSPRPPSLAPSLSLSLHHTFISTRTSAGCSQRTAPAQALCPPTVPPLVSSAECNCLGCSCYEVVRFLCRAAVWHTPMPWPKPRPRPQHRPKRRQHTQRHCVSNTWRPKPRPHRLLHRLRRQRRCGYSSNRSRRRWPWPRLKRRRLPRYAALD